VSEVTAGVRGSATTLRRYAPPGHPCADAIGMGEAEGPSGEGRVPLTAPRRGGQIGGVTSDEACVTDVQCRATT
jgi:hypothetical protein